MSEASKDLLRRSLAQVDRERKRSWLLLVGCVMFSGEQRLHAFPPAVLIEQSPMRVRLSATRSGSHATRREGPVWPNLTRGSWHLSPGVGEEMCMSSHPTRGEWIETIGPLPRLRCKCVAPPARKLAKARANRLL